MDDVTILKIGAILQRGVMDEAEATMQYLDQLAEIAELSPETAEKISPDIEEIIRDELNHQDKLRKLFVEITGLTPNED